MESYSSSSSPSVLNEELGYDTNFDFDNESTTSKFVNWYKKLPMMGKVGFVSVIVLFILFLVYLLIVGIHSNWRFDDWNIFQSSIQNGNYTPSSSATETFRDVDYSNLEKSVGIVPCNNADWTKFSDPTDPNKSFPNYDSTTAKTKVTANQKVLESILFLKSTPNQCGDTCIYHPTKNVAFQWDSVNEYWFESSNCLKYKASQDYAALNNQILTRTSSKVLNSKDYALKFFDKNNKQIVQNGDYGKLSANFKEEICHNEDWKDSHMPISNGAWIVPNYSPDSATAENSANQTKLVEVLRKDTSPVQCGNWCIYHPTEIDTVFVWDNSTKKWKLSNNTVCPKTSQDLAYVRNKLIEGAGYTKKLTDSENQNWTQKFFKK